MITLCKITATKPRIVTKRFNFIEGVLTKETSASVCAGGMQVVRLDSFIEFAELLVSLGTNQCLTYGVPPRDAALVTESQWAKLGRPLDPLPRSKSVFQWPNGSGVLMLDYDAPKDGGASLDKNGLISALAGAVPVFLGHQALWWPSTSSCIYAGDAELAGIKGQRIYLHIKDSKDIERAGKALTTRLWALGHGRYEVSTSGSLLERCLFDTSVWQTNRIDFAAGADCGAGLEQRRGRPVMIGKGDQPLDSVFAIPDPTHAEHEAAKAAKKVARQAIEGKAGAVRQAYIAQHTDALVDAGMDEKAARQLVERAVGHCDLGGDWPIIYQNEDGQESTATVLEILDNPHKYHGLKTLDPLEPDYDGRRWVGKLYLFSAKPLLYSLAHGGANFRLSRQPVRIEIVAGKAYETTNALLDVFRCAPDLYDFGSEIVTVHCGSIHPLNEHGVAYAAGGLTQFWRWHRLPNGEMVEQLTNPPADICKKILALGRRRELKRLDAVITAPTLRPDGSLLASPGYDGGTGLLYEASDLPPVITANPSNAHLAQALEFLWTPFKDFPFVGPVDRAVHLAALLTAAVRPTLPTSPAFAYDAPVQGSGKTLLARCVGVLAAGVDPGVWPHTAGRDDEEIRKRLFSVLRAGSRCIVWDNVVGSFDSASMASAITSPTYQDRILGASVSSTVPNKAILIFTGNNLMLAGEMPRRVMVSRIDPESDKPFSRQFDIDPFAYCQQNRQEMIAAALLLIRGYLDILEIISSEPIGKGKLASFEQWDAWVRQTVLFVNDHLMRGKFGDVMDSISANQAVDPEQESLGELLQSWTAVFGDQKVSASDVAHRAGESMFGEDPPLSALREALGDLTHGNLTAKSIGRALSYRVDRYVRGQRLRRHQGRAGTFLWSVECQV